MMKRYTCRNERCAGFGEVWLVTLDLSDRKRTGWVGPLDESAVDCATCGEQGDEAD